MSKRPKKMAFGGPMTSMGPVPSAPRAALAPRVGGIANPAPKPAAPLQGAMGTGAPPPGAQPPTPQQLAAGTLVSPFGTTSGTLVSPYGTTSGTLGFKRGGKIDGCAIRGHTKGRMR